MRYTIKDIYAHEVAIERDIETLSLDHRPVTGIFIHHDETIELQTPSEDERPLRYYFHGYQFWQLLHDGDEPSKEYAGQLEARLAYIQQIAQGNKARLVEGTIAPHIPGEPGQLAP